MAALLPNLSTHCQPTSGFHMIAGIDRPFLTYRLVYVVFSLPHSSNHGTAHTTRESKFRGWKRKLPSGHFCNSSQCVDHPNLRPKKYPARLGYPSRSGSHTLGLNSCPILFPVWRLISGCARPRSQTCRSNPIFSTPALPTMQSASNHLDGEILQGLDCLLAIRAKNPSRSCTQGVQPSGFSKACLVKYHALHPLGSRDSSCPVQQDAQSQRISGLVSELFTRFVI